MSRISRSSYETVTLVYTTVLTFLIEENKQEVNRFLAGESTPDHLKPGETGKCERSKFFGFACCCEQMSLAAKLNVVPGATLVITLGSILPTWEQEFENWVDKDVAPLRVAVLHNSAGRRKMQPSTKWQDLTSRGASSTVLTYLCGTTLIGALQ